MSPLLSDAARWSGWSTGLVAPADREKRPPAATVSPSHPSPHGESLADVLLGGPLTPKQAAFVGLQIAESLVHWHRARGLHLGIHPDSVVIDATATVRVLDEADSSSVSTRDRRPFDRRAFLAPEVLRGAQATPASDVYSIGALLLTMLTGLWTDHRRHVPRVGAPRRQPVSLPHRLAAICLRATAREPGQRYRDARSFVSALDTFLNDQAPELV